MAPCYERNQKSYKDSERPTLRLTAIAQTCWFVSVDVCKTSVKFLVDTGSAVTLISKQVFDKLESGKSDLKPACSQLTAADGGLLNTYGQAVFKFKIGGRAFESNTIVADLNGLPGIIGLDFLEKNNANLNLKKGLLKIRKLKISLERE